MIWVCQWLPAEALSLSTGPVSKIPVTIRRLDTKWWENTVQVEKIPKFNSSHSSVCLIFSSIWLSVSVGQMTDLIYTEKELVQSLREYIKEEESKLSALRRCIFNLITTITSWWISIVLVYSSCLNSAPLFCIVCSICVMCYGINTSK